MKQSYLERAALLVGAILIFAAPVSADSGVDDSRVSLPDGPGSIGGVGENAVVDPNMGMMQYSVTIESPAGFPAVTPQVALQYSSTSGASEVGVGWTMSPQTIERMTLRGLPEYTTDDVFAAGGGTELVYVGDDGGSRVYRARFEGGFVRYRWYDSGPAGYWTAELPDGTVEYYGADETDTLVSSARVTTPAGGVFKYYLVAREDTYGHIARYRYTKDGQWPLLDEIGYVYTAGTTPRFSIRFAYEARPDPISTGEPGFLLELSRRLSEIRISSGSEVIRTYSLTYESVETSGGASRLADVRQTGRGGTTTPVRFSFGYSRSLDGSCDGDCQGPYIVDMGSFPSSVELRNGRSTLLDINGDALPDLLSTSTSGVHTFVMSEIDMTTGEPRWSSTPVDSAATVGSSNFILSNPGVQVLDVDGDGFTDIISSRTGGGEVLCNEGTGDWGGSACLMNSTLPAFTEDDPGEANPLHTRFFDYDDDKRIDVIQTSAGSTVVYVNTTAGFVPQTVDHIGAQFDESDLQLADMNGDGLQDPVQMFSATVLRYRLNLGYGRWTGSPTEWIERTVEGFSESERADMVLEDLNGDGLSDMVVVNSSQVKIAINRGDRFDPAEVVTGVTGSIPTRDSLSTTVLFADMNGNGSRDIVWFDSGNAKFLELFPTKPNLLARIENGIGSVVDLTYGTSVLQQALDDETWDHALPFGMNIVTSMDSWNRLTGGEDGAGLHELTEFSYRSGYYDGVEKSFRGFSYVERSEPVAAGDETQEAGLTIFEYDVGDTDPYRNGKELRRQVFSGSGSTMRRLTESETEYSECPVAGIPSTGLRLPIRYVCQTGRETTVIEGAPQSEWLTVRDETTYDGYGQVTLSARLGVVHTGGPSEAACGACGGDATGPCGPSCLGDEAYTETQYIQPGAATEGAWILGTPSRVFTYGDPAGPRTETEYRYDGDAFVGLDPAGVPALTRGSVTSERVRVADGVDEWVYAQRNRFDEHGNVVELIKPNGSIGDTTNHRRLYVYEPLGLKATRVEVLLETTDGTAYTLRRDITYESSYLEPSEATDWMVFVGGSARTARNASRFRYDDFGRVEAILEPGDVDATPSREFRYELASPVSRIVSRTRSQLGGAQDLVQIRCIDGLGREVQQRTRVASGSYMVTGFQELNTRGQPVRVFNPYLSDTEACDMSPPAGRSYQDFWYDASGRQLGFSDPDEAVYGSRSVSRTEYAPLVARHYDQNDTDSESPYADTPTVEHYDGLGRLVALERDLGSDGAAVERFGYDSLGRLTSIVDPLGSEKVQEFDLLGRPVRVRDPNLGTSNYGYDAAGNVIEKTDARGRQTFATYDAGDRITARWDPSDEAGTRVGLTYDFDESCGECDNGANRLLSTRYPLGELGEGLDQIGYDPRGRTIYEARTIEGYRFESTYAFDNAGRMVRATVPGGTVLDWTYDDASRPTSLSGFIDDIEYQEMGLMSSMLHANGTRSVRAFDARQRLTSMEVRSAADEVLWGVEFERDRVGNIDDQVDLSDGLTMRPSLTAAYDYDSLYRLTGAAHGTADASEVVGYEYDVGDRVLSRVSSLGATSRAHVGDYEYDTVHPNAVVRAGTIDYGYDAAGRMTTRGERSYEWDHVGRLTRATRGGETQGTMLYGGDAARVAKLEDGGAIFYLSGALEVRDGIVEIHPRLARERVGRLRDDSLQTTLLSDVAPLAGPDDEINAGDAWVSHAGTEGILAGVVDPTASSRLLRGAARRLLLEDGDDLAFFHVDNLQSTVLATGPDGEVVGETIYYPDGALRYRSGYTDAHGFTGQEQDSSTGLTAFRHRHLDTVTGRWASPDPAFDVLNPDALRKIGEATTAYAYVANNPTNAYDPSGLNRVSDALGKVGGALKSAGKALGKAAGTVGRGLLSGMKSIAGGLGAAAKWLGGKVAENKLLAATAVASIVVGGLVGGWAGAGIVGGSLVAGALVGKALSFGLTKAAGASSKLRTVLSWAGSFASGNSAGWWARNSGEVFKVAVLVTSAFITAAVVASMGFGPAGPALVAGEFLKTNMPVLFSVGGSAVTPITVASGLIAGWGIARGVGQGINARSEEGEGGGAPAAAGT